MHNLEQFIHIQSILNSLILEKLNRIYAHLESDWDSLSEESLEEKYKTIQSLQMELFSQDKKRFESTTRIKRIK